MYEEKIFFLFYSIVNVDFGIVLDSKLKLRIYHYYSMQLKYILSIIMITNFFFFFYVEAFNKL